MQYLQFPDIDAKYLFDDEDLDKQGNIIKPQWSINFKLSQEIYKDMPVNCSTESKAIYIYFRLCRILNYDDEYFYAKYMTSQERLKYMYIFSRERLEKVVPGSNIVCFDFARLYRKLVRNLNDPNIIPYLKLHGSNKAHASMGFCNSKSQVELEPTALRLDKKTNDLLNLKIGVIPNGVRIIRDDGSKIFSSLRNMYELATKLRNPKELSDYLESLKDTEHVKLNLLEKLKAFSSNLKRNNVLGNESIQLLINLYISGFFGEKLKIALCAQNYKMGGNNKFVRKALIRIDNGDNLAENRSKYQYYLFDTNSSSISIVSPDMMSRGFISGLYSFENDTNKDKMPELLE